MIYRFYIFFIVTLTMGCVSSDPPPQTFYYLLEEQPLTYEWEEGSNVAQVDIVALPSYLLQPNLVMLEEKHQLYYANYHKWATDLRDNIQHVLLADLNEQFSDVNFVKSCEGCPTIFIHVLGFYPTLDGEVHLHGFFEVDLGAHDTTGIESVKRHSFALVTPIETGDYQGAVSAMRMSLKALSLSIKHSTQQRI